MQGQQRDQPRTDTAAPTQLPALSSVPIKGELDVDAVWVGLGTAADFSGRDVRGKAVVFHMMLALGETGQSAVFENATKIDEVNKLDPKSVQPAPPSDWRPIRS